MEKNGKVLELCKQYDSQKFLEQDVYRGRDLGATLSEDGTTFKVWSPFATKVELSLYKNGNKEAIEYKNIEMSKSLNGVWVYQTSEKLDEIYYTYSITHDDEAVSTGDIYAKACGVNSEKSMVVDLEKTNPLGWDKDDFSYDTRLQPIIYELHIKDFSFDENSGISEENRGKYLAFTEGESCFQKDITKPTGISYLKELGISHVHILPMYDYESIDETKSDDSFNWGYDPVNYNVPEGSYSTNPFDGKVRIKEMKEMIMALHNAGIGVIMDVVYNHTYNTDSFFQKTVPYYYYRTNELGEFSDGSACGNDTASERFMYRKYMIESILYWAKEYHLDGFRFDLMGLHDVETMNLIRRELNELPKGQNILMYGEPWFANQPCMIGDAIPAIKDNLDKFEDGIAIFLDNTRDVIKGSVFYEEVGGYINGDLTKSKDVPSCVRAYVDSNEVKAKNPSQIISYISAHDNFTLYDKLVLTLGEECDFKTVNEDLIQVNKLAAGIYLTSCGISFFQAGEEFARTKQGIGDSYNSSAYINMLDYKRAYELQGLVDYYKDLIAFRKTIPTFMEGDRKPSEEIEFVKQENDNLVGFIVKDKGDNSFYILYNPCNDAMEVELPAKSARVICDGEKFIKEVRLVEKKTKIPHKSMMIFKVD